MLFCEHGFVVIHFTEIMDYFLVCFMGTKVILTIEENLK